MGPFTKPTRFTARAIASRQLLLTTGSLEPHEDLLTQRRDRDRGEHVLMMHVGK